MVGLTNTRQCTDWKYFSALEVYYENALYKFTFDIDIANELKTD